MEWIGDLGVIEESKLGLRMFVGYFVSVECYYLSDSKEELKTLSVDRVRILK